jgi:phage gp29-like protein
MAAILGQIKAMLAAAGSLEEFGAMLDAAFPDLDRSALTTVLGDAFQVAALQGVADVQAETA